MISTALILFLTAGGASKIDQPNIPPVRFTGALSRIACAATVPDAVVRNVSGLALLIASIGIYGDLAYLTHQRVPEIGVRMALGTSAREVM